MNSMRIGTRVVAAAAALSFASGLAMAQQHEKQEKQSKVEKRVEKRVKAQAGGGEGEGTLKKIVVEGEDGERYEVVIRFDGDEEDMHGEGHGEWHSELHGGEDGAHIRKRIIKFFEDEHEIEHEGIHELRGLMELDGGSGLHGGEAMRFGWQPEGEVRSHAVVVQRDDDHEIKLEIKGDEVSAWIDGERVPEKRLRVNDDRVRVLDEDGETVFTFDRRQQMGGGVVAPRLPGAPRGLTAPRAPDAPGAPRAMVAPRPRGDDDGNIVWRTAPLPGDYAFAIAQPEADQVESHPPVMIGINMGPLEEADGLVREILEDRDLDGEDVIVVLGVIDGLPAKKAGLREGDVVVRVDGKWGVNPSKLRGILSEKEPGDELEFLVIRDGKRREFAVELAPYRSSALRSNVEVAPSPDMRLFGGEGFGGPDMAELRKKIEAVMGERGALNDEARKQLKDALAMLEDRDIRLEVMPRVWMDEQAPDAPRMFVEPRRLRLDRLPGADAQESRLDRLEERIEGLEDRMDRIIDLLERRERDDR